MLNQSQIQETALVSPLRSVSVLNPKGGIHKRSMYADLLLTSLVDAFSILVIYLLIYFGGAGEIITIEKGQVLPTATQTDMLERNTLVKVTGGKFFVGEEEMGSSEALIARLMTIRKEIATEKNEDPLGDAALTIQADKEIKYEVLNQIVLAGSHAGFSDIHFAVIQN